MTTNILNPKVSLSIAGSQTLSAIQDRRMLIIGQQLTGTASDGDLTENINALTDAEINSLFGQGSLVAGMIRSARRNLVGITPQPQIDVIGLDDAGGATQATAVITFSGPATEDGTLTLIVGSKTDHSFTIAVSNEDTATTIGDALVAAITADGNAPFTAVNSSGAVTLTAENGGTTPNTWGIGFDGSVAGVAVTLTTEWSSGATDPTLTTLFDPIDDTRETTIIWPEAYPLATVAAFLDARFNVANAVLDGVALSVHANTLSNLKAAVFSLNSQSVVVIANTFSTTDFVNKKGPGVFEIPDNIAAEIGIIRDLRLTEGAPITQFINAAGAPNDAFGGIAISSKPYHNTILPNISIPQPGEYFNQVDQDDLISNGVSVFGANRSNNAVVLGTQVTTYLTDSSGNPDTSFKFLNTVDQSSIIREFYVNNLLSRYSQSRLTDGTLSLGFGIENQASIRGLCIQLYQELAEQVITQSGNVALQDYKDSLSVVVDVAEGKVTINQAPLLVGQIRVIIGTIEVNFG